MQTSYNRILCEKFIFYPRKMKRAVLRSLNSSTLHRELLTCGRSTGTQNHSLISLSLKQQLLHVRLELMRGVGLRHHVAETPHFSGFIFKVRVIINLNQQQRGNESLICLS